MEGWQKNIITSNLSELVSSTRKLDDVIEELQSFWDVLTFEEAESLRARIQSQGQHAACKRMYNLLMTKPNSFKPLFETLRSTEQQNAYSILVDEMESNLGYSDMNYDDHLENLEYRSHLAVRVLEETEMNPLRLQPLSHAQTFTTPPSTSGRDSFRNAQTSTHYPIPNHDTPLNMARGFSLPQRASSSSAQKVPAHQRSTTTSLHQSQRLPTRTSQQIPATQQPSRASSSRSQISSTSSSIQMPVGFAEEKIVFNPIEKNELGRGSGGTIVYRGTYGKRVVAVKQLTDFKNSEVAKREIDMLSTLDRHENVIRYHAMEIRSGSGTILLALELADATLEKWIDDKNCIRSAKLTPKNLLRQATDGLNYLHQNGVIHRDLKPNNILLAVLSPNKVLVKISDFGICRLIESGRTSKTITAVVGTEGWMAPEILRYIDECRRRRKERPASVDEKATMTKLVDVFSLGCVFYYVLTDGDHPFGDADIEYNIKHGKDIIDDESQNLDIVCNQYILRMMISQNPSDRPRTSQILLDPIFWPYDRIIQFLVDISDFVEDVMLESSKPTSKQDVVITTDPLYGKKERCINDMELAYREEICQNYSNGWFHHTCDVLRSHLERDKYTKHSFNSVLKLVRVIRNMRNHYGKLDASIRDALGSVPDGYMEYWLKRFPLIVYHVRNAFECLGNDPKLRVYYYP